MKKLRDYKFDTSQYIFLDMPVKLYKKREIEDIKQENKALRAYIEAQTQENELYKACLCLMVKAALSSKR